MGPQSKCMTALCAGLSIITIACSGASPSGLTTGDHELPGAEERFEVDSEAGLVTDIATGRTWLESTPGVALTWVQADAFCDSQGMRLPTVGELALLITSDPQEESGCALDEVFKGDCGEHWSSEQTTPAKPTDKWNNVDRFTVDMWVGELGHRSQDDVAATRCVRDAASLDPDRAEPLSHIGDVLWMRASSRVAVFHSAAEEACDSLCYAGNCDWRLPSRDELVELTLTAADDCLMPSSLDGPCASYWSATQSSSVTAFQVDFEAGLVDEFAVEEWAHFRCVSDLQ